MLIQATHENAQPVGRHWYAVLAVSVLLFSDMFYKAAMYDGLPFLAAALLVFFAAAAIKTQQILAPKKQSVWGRVVRRDAALLALAVVLMQAVWHWIGWGHLSGGPTGAIALLGIVVVAPIFEEAVFRGLGFKVFNFGPGRAATSAQIALSTAAFAAYHYDYWGTWSLILVFVAGVLFGVARHRSGGILLPIMLHALMNALAVGIPLWR